MTETTYLSKSGVLSRGWIPELIDQLLGEPDFIERHASGTVKARRFSIERVLLAEASEAFQAHKQRQEAAWAQQQAVKRFAAENAELVKIAERYRQQEWESKREWFSKSSLLAKGWTPALIQRFLGEPDEKRPNPYGEDKPPMNVFFRSRVMTAEALPEFAGALRVAWISPLMTLPVADQSFTDLMGQVARLLDSVRIFSVVTAPSPVVAQVGDFLAARLTEVKSEIDHRTLELDLVGGPRDGGHTRCQLQQRSHTTLKFTDLRKDYFYKIVSRTNAVFVETITG